MNPLSYFITRFAAKIIAVDDTAVPYTQLKLLHDMLRAQTFELDGKDAKKLLQSLKRKHLLNSITVLKTNSTLVFSSEGNGAKEAENAASLFKFVDGRFSKPETVAVKRGRDWLLLTQSNGKLFIVKANSSLSSTELRAIARDIECAMGKQL